jgi:hypothetical protein
VFWVSVEGEPGVTQSLRHVRAFVGRLVSQYSPNIRVQIDELPD